MIKFFVKDFFEIVQARVVIFGTQVDNDVLCRGIAGTVSQKSLKKNFIIQSMERKKIGQIQGRISRRRLVRNPTTQYIIINLHTKYEYSSLHSFTEIFTKNFINRSMERKKIGQIQRKISRRRLVKYREE